MPPLSTCPSTFRRSPSVSAAARKATERRSFTETTSPSTATTSLQRPNTHGGRTSHDRCLSSELAGCWQGMPEVGSESKYPPRALTSQIPTRCQRLLSGHFSSHADRDVFSNGLRVVSSAAFPQTLAAHRTPRSSSLSSSPLSAWSTLGPLALVLLITMIKEGAEDWTRHASDREVNNRSCPVLQVCGAGGGGQRSRRGAEETKARPLLPTRP